MELKLNALLKVMMKEKGVPEVEVGASEPILPTPPAHLTLMIPTEMHGGQPEGKGKTFTPNLPDLKCLCSPLVMLGSG